MRGQRRMRESKISGRKERGIMGTNMRECKTGQCEVDMHVAYLSRIVGIVIVDDN